MRGLTDYVIESDENNDEELGRTTTMHDYFAEEEPMNFERVKLKFDNGLDYTSTYWPLVKLEQQYFQDQIDKYRMNVGPVQWEEKFGRYLRPTGIFSCVDFMETDLKSIIEVGDKVNFVIKIIFFVKNCLFLPKFSLKKYLFA